MKASEVLELIRAGYSKDEIAALDDTPTGGAGDPAPTPAEPRAPQPQPADPDPKPAPAAPAATAAPAADPQPAPTDGITAVLAEMTRTLKQLQAANVAGSNNPAPTSAEDKTREILAEIIAPPQKGSKTK